MGSSTSVGAGYQRVCIKHSATEDVSEQLRDKMYLRNN